MESGEHNTVCPAALSRRRHFRRLHRRRLARLLCMTYPPFDLGDRALFMPRFFQVGRLRRAWRRQFFFFFFCKITFHARANATPASDEERRNSRWC